MLVDLFPRAHVRFSSLLLLGPHVDDFAVWLDSRGYPADPIRIRVRETPRLEARLRRRGIRRLADVSRAQLRSFAPADSQDDIEMCALVGSLGHFLEGRGLLAVHEATPIERLVAEYDAQLDRLRGFAPSTRHHHCATASELLVFIGYDRDRGVLSTLGHRDIERFVESVGSRISRASLQHTTSQMRSFVGFLAARGDVPRGLNTVIDTPRLYRGEKLPRALPWEMVRTFLGSIDRSSVAGRRDYAMFLLIATYGLRTSEIAALRLDGIEWRAEHLRVQRRKVTTPLALPLTSEVGAAIHDYLRNARPQLPYREVFLRVRAPAGPIAPTAVTEAFQCWTRRSALPIRQQGPHCLRHSLAVHLLREGTSLKTIGDVLGHRSSESTCVYLRLQIEDLRDAGLDLPKEARP